MMKEQELFEKNTNLVYKVFHDKLEHRLENPNMKDDLIQIGMLSLWKCCKRYDPEKGTTFSTYAYSAIYKSMTCALVREYRKTVYLVSLNKQVNSDIEENPVALEDIIASPVNLASEVEIDDMVNRITDSMGKDSDKILEMIRQGYSQVDIAKQLKTTRSNVGRILKKFRKKLKNTLFLED